MPLEKWVAIDELVSSWVPPHHKRQQNAPLEKWTLQGFSSLVRRKPPSSTQLRRFTWKDERYKTMTQQEPHHLLSSCGNGE
jgi:hypothetical protein